MKVRIGVGAGAGLRDPKGAGALVDGLADHGLDSVWLSEVLTTSAIDPLVGLAWAAAHHPDVKLGTTMLAPGRNPLRLAKSLATLDSLSSGRLLVTFVPGLPRSPEREAVGPPPSARGQLMDEMLPLVRRLWAGETVSHHGAVGDFDDVTLAPLPSQDPLEVWLGGMAPAALERCGRLADGWLPSRCTPESAAAGRAVINRVAAEAGRSIDPEHFGISLAYAWEPLSPAEVTARAQLQGPRAALASPSSTPVGAAALRAAVEGFIAVGFSKFVLRPVRRPGHWDAELGRLAAAVGDLQS